MSEKPGGYAFAFAVTGIAPHQIGKNFVLELKTSDKCTGASGPKLFNATVPSDAIEYSGSGSDRIRTVKAAATLRYRSVAVYIDRKLASCGPIRVTSLSGTDLQP
jgi:hypothetical protein